MSSTDTTPTRQALEAQDRSAPMRVTGKLRRAIDAMVWDGSTRNHAAVAAGMSVHGLREALRRPHVKAYYRAQLEVLRESERARNIHALVDVRDEAPNAMARVQAVKALELIGDGDQAAGARLQAPGIVIMIGASAPQTEGPPTVTIGTDK